MSPGRGDHEEGQQGSDGQSGAGYIGTRTDLSESVEILEALFAQKGGWMRKNKSIRLLSGFVRSFSAQPSRITLYIIARRMSDI